MCTIIIISWLQTLEERLLRRKMIAQMRENKTKEDQDQIEVSCEHYKSVLDDLVADGKMMNRQADALLAEYKRNMENVQNKHNQGKK